MLKIPEANLFPGTGATGNGVPAAMRDQGQWLRFLKTDSCNSCHQIGNKSTRTIPASLGHFTNSAAAWERRIQSGQASQLMVNGIGNFDTARALTQFRRLDGSRREGRAAVREAVASDRHRAQLRRHAVGLEHAARLSA